MSKITSKEQCAMVTMRMMLQDYAADNNISEEEALHLFSSTCVHEALFDFDTWVWMEGPDYLRGLFEQALAAQKR